MEPILIVGAFALLVVVASAIVSDALDMSKTTDVAFIVTLALIFAAAVYALTSTALDYFL